MPTIKVSTPNTEFSSPCWSVRQQLIICYLLKLNEHLTNQSLDTQRLVFTEKGTQLWCLNAKADHWRLVTKSEVATVSTSDEVDRFLKQLIDHNEMHLLSLSSSKLREFIQAEQLSRSPRTIMVSDELLQLNKWLLKLRDNRSYYASCWGCG